MQDNKTCTHCHEVKSLLEFHQNRKMADGHLNQCKQCANKASRRRYEEDPEAQVARVEAYRSREPHRYKARSLAYSAVRRGTIRREGCEVCGGKAEMHHDDYAQPLVVRWMCRTHHREMHA